MSDEHTEQDNDQLPEIGPTPEHGYWRSIRELDGKATIQTDRSGKEFATEPSRLIDPLHRRNFMQLMGASMGLAGLSACQRYEKEDIVPLSRRPEDQVPGTTLQYATAFELGGVGYPLLATSYEGRPIKVDGNPEHPYASGTIVKGAAQGFDRRSATTAFVQGSLLHLYDPDRSQSPLARGNGTTLDAFRAALAEAIKNPAGLRILSEATSSPTIGILKNELKGVQWHEYEAVSWDNERAGMRMAFGTSVRPLAKLDQCATIVTIDCDIFLDHPASLMYSRDWARSRRKDGWLGTGQMNRLWSVESSLTNTGAMADHRLALRSEFGLPFLLALESKLGIGATPQAKFLQENRVDPFLTVLAEELQQNKGKAVLIAGRRQPPEVHAVVARINQSIGAVGTVLDYVQDIEPNRPTHLESITQLVKDINAGSVKSLIIFGGNPVYDAPADLDFGAAMGRVATTMHLHEYVNETSKKATWHVPRAHYLEAWGDTRSPEGTITIAQPLIAPLYGGLSVAEVLAYLAGIDKTGSELIRWVHEDKLHVGGSWRQNVEKGYVQGSALPIQTVALTSFPQPQLTDSQRGSSARSKDDYEITFQLSSFTYDGRFANNAWLWETPDFLTKVTWDNFALVSQASGLPNDTMIEVSVAGGKKVQLPAYTIPGQAKSTITLVLGGGRTAAGRVGGDGGDHDSVGWDTYKVRTTGGFDIAKASASSTGDKYELASIQEHWDIRTGLINSVTPDGIAKRLPELIRETTNASLQANKNWSAEEAEGDFWKDPNNGKPRGYSLFEEKEYGGHRWGMAIDLSTCMGCNACMVACQAENNVPVVGRKEVMNNREMSWIRIDRYFKGTVEEPEVVHQPIACQHCEMAPCEAVCPVGATQHSDEGLNDMAYNRCIGTRYCANNCPYKVRRFNFLDWNKEWRDARNKVRRLLFNPEVTVRMRGVMEKCTFCVQRIQNAKIKAKADVRAGNRTGPVHGPLHDGEVTTACQAACPTEAIVFGDLSDKNSRVAKLHDDRRSYALLPETYTKPRNRFLARVRNPNPKLVSAAGANQGGHE